jgi:phosphoglycolate phosphatase
MSDSKLDVLFDLDGTLTDSAPGIVRCIQHALLQLGTAPRSIDTLTLYVGPPLQEAFANLLETDDAELVAQAVALYRQRFVTHGMFENALYPDVAEALTMLRDRGHRLWVATSKAHVYARPILRHFQIDGLFDGIYGAELSGNNADKRDLIRTLLDAESIDPANAVMVGDRRHDMIGALANGVAGLGALWGYGTREELQTAGAHWLAASIAEACEQVQGPAPPRQPRAIA